MAERPTKGKRVAKEKMRKIRAALVFVPGEAEGVESNPGAGSRQLHDGDRLLRVLQAASSETIPVHSLIIPRTGRAVKF